jgi:hypothetical protein
MIIDWNVYQSVRENSMFNIWTHEDLKEHIIMIENDQCYTKYTINRTIKQRQKKNTEKIECQEREVRYQNPMICLYRKRIKFCSYSF